MKASDLALAIGKSNLFTALASLVKAWGKEQQLSGISLIEAFHDAEKLHEREGLLSLIDDLVDEISKTFSVDRETLLPILIHLLSKQYSVSQKKTSQFIQYSQEQIPLEIFSTKLSGLEAIVKYLKEHLSMSFANIARVLNRDPATIWVTYRNAVLKKKATFTLDHPENTISLSALQNRRLSIFESVVYFLKTSRGHRYSEIARMLNRDQRNIWSTVKRAQTKLDERRSPQHHG